MYCPKKAISFKRRQDKPKEQKRRKNPPGGHRGERKSKAGEAYTDNMKC